jgi:ATP-dependent RNA helicase RhlE
MSFKQLDLIDPILKALAEKGYEHPTPIQASAIPHILNKRDVIGCAQTGSGKTAAFAIPILQTVYKHENDKKGKIPIRCLIVTPTRELAIQIDENFKLYAKHTNIKSTVVFGGVNQAAQVRAIKQGIHILTATPGRLLDLMNQGIISLKDIKIFVLDEADRMLDMGFIHDIKKLLKVIPEKRQSLFFSATMPDNITKLANSILKNPERIEVTPVSSTVDTISQYLYYTNKKQKRDLLLHVLQDEKMESVLVFTRTKYGADKVARLLTKKGSKAAAIHGDKSQNNRQKSLKAFKEGKLRVLVATDIAARGIDIDSLKYVINFEISNMPETYVHRIGRSGRAGKDGVAISFCDHTERAYVKDIQKLTGRKLDVVSDHPFPQSDVDPALEAGTDNKQKGNNKNNKRQNNSNKNQNNRNRDQKKLDKRKPPKSKFSEKRAVAAEKQNEIIKHDAEKVTEKKGTHQNNKKQDVGKNKPPKGKRKPYDKKKNKGMPEGLKKKMMWPLG